MVNLLKVPDGWTVSIAASGLGKPSMLYYTPNGNLYITRRDTGDVLLLKDPNGDGKFEDVKTVAADFKGVRANQRCSGNPADRFGSEYVQYG